MCDDDNFMEVGSFSESDQFSDGDVDDFMNVIDDGEGSTCPVQEFVTLEPAALFRHMLELVNDVHQITNLPKTLIRMLLEHFRWEKDTLIEQYFEHSHPRLFASALIMPSLIDADGNYPCLQLRPYTEVFPDASSREVVCDICCVQCPPANLLALGCKHFFCRSCWISYLQGKVDENQGSRITCAAFRCENLMSDESVFQLLQSLPASDATSGDNDNGSIARSLLRYHRLILNSFVLQNRSLTWCPGADCGHAVKAMQPLLLSDDRCIAKEVVCDNCGENFCFACGNPWHEPVLCKYLKRWLSKVENDAGTSHWIAANTKECPKCKATIEKNGGCNHMICRNLSCKYEFCWVCLDSWSPHGSQWYTCNRFKETAAQQARDSQESSRAALSRYLFFFDRYANHAQSRRFESKLYESIQGRMEELQKQGMSWIDVKFVRRVVDVLCACRRTLMYTYAFAYYLESNNQSVIFEGNQSDLEQATEQLSEFLEWDLSTATLADLKRKLQDKSKYCEQRRKVLLDHVTEGYDKDLWLHRHI